MIRRAHIAQLHAGQMELAAPQAHHVRNVLRLGEGDMLELFDNEGAVAQGRIVVSTEQAVRIQVDEIRCQATANMELTIGSAIPKGTRADWMIEKLSELGVSRFMPLLTDRSVVRLEGANKIQRWGRLATEAARQSRRRGVLKIEDIDNLHAVISEGVTKAYSMACLSTAPDALPLCQWDEAWPRMVLVGPEGGWTTQELRLMKDANMAQLRLTHTVLRTETAAVAAAAILLCGRE